MRKGRFELWLGGGCVLLVCLAALLGSYRKEIQVGYLFWRFNGCTKGEACREKIEGLLTLGEHGRKQLRRILVAEPEDLRVVSRTEKTISVVNDRRHRVLLRAFTEGHHLYVHHGIWSEKNWSEISASLEGPRIVMPRYSWDTWARKGSEGSSILKVDFCEDFATALDPGERADLILVSRS